MRTVLGVFLLASAAWSQGNPFDPNRPVPGVDYQKVEQAIQNGVKYLRTADSPGAHRGITDCDELILLTLVDCDLPETDSQISALLKKCLDEQLEKTYNVCLLAMALEEIDRVKYQGWIHRCAQFLVDNQCSNGQWSYGKPSIFAEDIPTTAGRRGVASGVRRRGARRDTTSLPPPGVKIKPKVAKRRKVSKKRDLGEAGGDNSNSQYAALGIRACHDGGIDFPSSVISKAKNWWASSQHKPEKGGKPLKPGERPGVASGRPIVYGTPRGWCYDDVYGVCKKTGPSYCSMSAGAVGAVIIYNYIQGKKWERDKVVRDGLAWMAANYTVTENAGPPEVHQGNTKAYYLYYLYALERVGMLYGTETIGSNLWYADGAKVLLENQNADGSWSMSEGDKNTWDTCFAILFLKRATKPLDVATGGGR